MYALNPNLISYFYVLSMDCGIKEVLALKPSTGDLRRLIFMKINPNVLLQLQDICKCMRNNSSMHYGGRKNKKNRTILQLHKTKKMLSEMN